MGVMKVESKDLTTATVVYENLDPQKFAKIMVKADKILMYSGTPSFVWTCLDEAKTDGAYNVEADKERFGVLWSTDGTRTDFYKGKKEECLAIFKGLNCSQKMVVDGERELNGLESLKKVETSVS